MGIEFESNEAHLLEVSAILSTVVEKAPTDPERLQKIREGVIALLNSQLADQRAELEQVDAKPSPKKPISEVTRIRRLKAREALVKSVAYLVDLIENVRNGKNTLEWLQNEVLEEEVLGATLSSCGFEDGWELIVFTKNDQLEEYDFELKIPYIMFDTDTLLKESKQGRKLVTEPTPAYEALCDFIGIEEIKAYHWISWA